LNMKEKQLEKLARSVFFENNHYLWLSIEGGKTTWFKVDAQVYHVIEEEGRHLKWNYEPFWISKTNSE
jgi:hypothetical protein